VSSPGAAARGWWTAASLLAVAGPVAAAAPSLRAGLIVQRTADWPLPTLVVVLALLPLALLLAGRHHRRGTVAAVLAAAGALGVLGGPAAAARDDFLDLRLAAIGWRVAATSTGALAPVGCAVLGVALLLLAVGLLRARRDLLLAGAVGSGLVAAALAASSAAGPVASLAYLGGTLAHPDVWLRVAVLLAAAVLTPAVALRRPPVTRAQARPAGRGTRLLAAVAALALVVGGLALTRSTAPRTPLADVFPDPALAACVAAALDLADPQDEVADAALADVRSLACDGDAGGSPVQSLAGVERLTELASLGVTEGAVTDLTPLTGLPRLNRLTLTNNAIQDLTPLAGLPVLTDLGLSGNRVDDVTPLATVPTLAFVGLSRNEIRDVTPLGSLPALAELALDENQVTDLAGLAGSPVDRLSLAGNGVSDLSPAATMPDLRVLDVTRNQVGDVAALAGADLLEELWLSENPVVDVTPLLSLPALTGVDLESAAPVRGIEELRAAGVHVGTT